MSVRLDFGQFGVLNAACVSIAATDGSSPSRVVQGLFTGSLLQRKSPIQASELRQEVELHLGELTTRNVKSVVGSNLHVVGDTLQDKYRVESILGQGGTATTLKCVRLIDEKLVAVKFLSLRSASSWKQIEQFEREVQVLQQLDHPSIPAYVDSFEIDTETDRKFYIVQELADGISLAELVESGLRVSEDEVKRIALVLLGVLLYLSNLQPPVVHRDVKPENVILQGGVQGGHIYLVDFGGVQGVDFTGSTVVGSYGYMAPEQFRGMAGVKSDLYGLGATLLFLISGRHPTSFPQDRLKIDFSDSVFTSESMSSLLEALLEPLPEDRIDAEDAIAILSDDPRAEKASGIHSRGWRPRKKSRPVGARATVRRRGDKDLEIDIPAAGLEGVNMATGTFALAWNAFVLFWSYSAVVSGGILPLLFSIPFWYAGAEIAKLSLASCLTHQNLKIKNRNFYLIKELAFLQRKDESQEMEDLGLVRTASKARKNIKGKTSDMTKAEVVTSAVVNGSPQTCIEFSEGVHTHVFGEGLTRIEQEWLVDEINGVLQNITGDLTFP